ncbi:hypothetical protein CN330_24210 [Priestia megaterium]|uniref:hypothetical protein n=1 Tax=Priestia megaterium TaxID=1404 RepID=UPI000BF4CA10|nr:hypothetical protein [Priestia megaterium]PEZ08322.1 hypothetical protein CN330_24210 [Priestia megaterium]
MGIIVQGDFNKKESIYKYHQCSGCLQELADKTDYTEVLLPYEDRTEHILLCPTCYTAALSYGVL